MSNMKKVRTVKIKRKRRGEMTKEKYYQALQKDEETIEIIRRNIGTLGALDTPEKRACFRLGLEAGPHAKTGTFSNPDTEHEKFHAWRALHPHYATPDHLDAYYATLGACLSEAWW
jgi:hypothetical protein